jgi:hypothetical protein
MVIRESFEEFIGFVRDDPYMDPERVANRNVVRAMTIATSGVIAVGAALTGHEKIAKWATIYGGAQAVTGIIEHVIVNTEPGYSEPSFHSA